jgi:hypothetical protein
LRSTRSRTRGGTPYPGRRPHPPTRVGSENTACADIKASPSRRSSPRVPTSRKPACLNSTGNRIPTNGVCVFEAGSDPSDQAGIQLHLEECARVAEAKTDIAEAEPVSTLLGHGDLGGILLDPHHGSAGPDHLGDLKRDVTRAGAEIEDAHPRPNAAALKEQVVGSAMNAACVCRRAMSVSSLPRAYSGLATQLTTPGKQILCHRC